MMYFPTKRGAKLKIPRILKDLRVSRQVVTEGTQKNYFSLNTLPKFNIAPEKLPPQ